MNKTLLTAIGVGAAALLLVATPARAGAVDLGPVKTGSAAAEEWDRLLQIAGVSEDWRRFFALKARTESRFTPNVFLGRIGLMPAGAVPSGGIETLGENEYQAARKVYLASTYLFDCPWGEDRYSVAGGMVGLLGANAVRPYKGTRLECIDPWKMFDIRESVPMTYGHARRLYVNRKPSTWLEMASAWGIPAKTKDPERLAKLRVSLKKHMDALKIPMAWLEKKIEPLPKRNLVSMRETVLNAVGYAPPSPRLVEHVIGDRNAVGRPTWLWLCSDQHDADLLGSLLGELDGDALVHIAVVNGTDEVARAISAASTEGPIVLLAHHFAAAGHALAAGCAAGDRVAEMFLCDPMLPECLPLPHTRATVTAWVTQRSGVDLRAVGRTMSQAARAGAHVRRVDSIDTSATLDDVWPWIIDGIAEAQNG